MVNPTRKLRAILALLLFSMIGVVAISLVLVGIAQTIVIVIAAGLVIFGALVCATIGLGYPLKTLFADFPSLIGDMLKEVIWEGKDIIDRS